MTRAPPTAPAYPFSVRAQLGGSAALATRLGQALRVARRFLDESTLAEVAKQLIPDDADRASFEACLSHISHVGFLAPGEEEALVQLGPGAIRNGFDQGSATFPSAIVSQELARRAGRARVPTTIFRAFGRAPRDRPQYVEVFVPQEVSTLVDRWVDEEVATHVGLTLRHREGFEPARRALMQADFRVPAFMGDKPMTNSSDGTTALYLDGRVSAGPVRVELMVSG